MRRRTDNYDFNNTQYAADDQYDDYGDGNQETLGFSCADSEENQPDDYLEPNDTEYIDDDDDLENELTALSETDDDDKTRAKDASLLLNENDKYYKNLSKDEITAKWLIIVDKFNNGDENEQKEAADNAIQQLSGYVHSLIERKYHTYYEQDPSFREDLEQVGKMGIIKALGRYDPKRALPTTFFYTAIKHELFELTNCMRHETKSHVATTRKKLEAIQRRCKAEGYEANEPFFQYITGDPYRRIVNVLETMKINKNKLNIDDPDAREIADSDPRHLGTEAEAISNANTKAIVDIIRQVCKKDEELCECIIDRYVNGVSLDDLAERCGRTKDQLASEIGNVLKLLQYDDRLNILYPELAPSDRRRNINQEIMTMPEFEDDLKSTDLIDLISQQDDDTIRRQNAQMSNMHARFHFEG